MFESNYGINRYKKIICGYIYIILSGFKRIGLNNILNDILMILMIAI